MAESTIPFPSNSSVNIVPVNQDSTRSAWNRASAIDVHRTLYSLPTASESLVEQANRAKASFEQLYERDAVYENPLITATSSSIISDIHALVHQLLQIDAPSPRSVFASILMGSRGSSIPPLFHISKAWSEILDISESDGFDRSQKVHLEHMVHLLILPGLHSNIGEEPPSDSLDLVSTNSFPSAPHYHYIHHAPQPRLSVLGLKLPSPFHISLRVHSRLSFNDAGRITYHRDMWDVKDLIRAAVPGARLTLWLTSRLGGYGLAAASRWTFWLLGGGTAGTSKDQKLLDDEKRFDSPSSGSHSSNNTSDKVTTDEDNTRNALGLLGLRDSNYSSSARHFFNPHLHTAHPSQLPHNQSHQSNGTPDTQGRRATADSLDSLHYHSSSYGTSVDIP